MKKEIDYDKLYQAAYEAFLKAAKETGDAWKQLSWFTKNRIG